MENFQAKWVAPFYLKILHANYIGLVQDQEREVFKSQVREALSEIDENVVTRLLSGAWREQITGSWFCGLRGWSQFGDTIGNLLVPSRTCYAGQGYCYALACFADDTSTEYLIRYLDTYLPEIDLQYDQHWALPALMWIDERQETSHSLKYLEPGGMWEKYIADKLRVSDSWHIDKCKNYFWRTMEFRGQVGGTVS